MLNASRVFTICRTRGFNNAEKTYFLTSLALYIYIPKQGCRYLLYIGGYKCNNRKTSLKIGTAKLLELSWYNLRLQPKLLFLDFFLFFNWFQLKKKIVKKNLSTYYVITKTTSCSCTLKYFVTFALVPFI